jgi:predicted nucleic acid-binding protein
VIVLDASAAIEWLLQTRVGQGIEARLFGEGETLHAPYLLDVEVAQVLRRFAAAGRITSERGLEALDDLTDLAAVRYPHQMLLPRTWELRHNLTAYDAIYIALAEALGAVLVTCDARLAEAPGHQARVEVFGPA